MSNNGQPQKKPAGQRKRTVRLPDGVVLLEQVGRPDHFTVQQIRRAIRELRRDRDGRFVRTAAE